MERSNDIAAVDTVGLLSIDRDGKMRTATCGGVQMVIATGPIAGDPDDSGSIAAAARCGVGVLTMSS